MRKHPTDADRGPIEADFAEYEVGYDSEEERLIAEHEQRVIEDALEVEDC